MIMQILEESNTFNSFIYWITERESIRLKRESGQPRPWTADPILNTYRFCNVRRMDDRVSNWLYNYWYRPNIDHRNMLLACALARFINLPASLEIIGYPYRFSPETIIHRLRAYWDQGNQIFNGAYMIRGNDGMDKIECVVNYYVLPLKGLLGSVDTQSMERTWSALLGSYGMGSFMAGQIVADLRWGLKGKWSDRKTWAPLGPGSQRGANRLLGRPINTPMKQEEFNEILAGIIAQCQERLPREITRRLEAIDYQNCLCEFDKYARTLYDGRRPKALFRSAQ